MVVLVRRPVSALDNVSYDVITRTHTQVGKVYEDCTVMGVHPFGVFVELFPGKVCKCVV